MMPPAAARGRTDSLEPSGPPPAAPALRPGARPWLAKYPASVPPEVSIPDRSLAEVVEESVARWGRRTAFVFSGARWSYARFWDESGRFAAALARDGFRPGDRLGLLLPNCPLYPFAFFGALRAGLVVVPLSPLYGPQDLAAVLSDSRPRGVVTLDIFHGNVAPHLGSQGLEREYVAPLRAFYPIALRPFVNRVLRRHGYRPGPPRPSERVRSWREVRRIPGPAPRVSVPPGETVAVLQYTGGTTGTPKAAMLSHRNLVANAIQCRMWFSAQGEGTGVVLASVPFFHIYGLTVALVYPLLAGSTVVLELRPDPAEILRLVARYRPTELPGVPALYQAILDRPDVGRYDLRSIRVCVSGSAPLPLELARRFESVTGGRLVEGYGLTEASPVTHANPIEGENRVGSIGLPLPGTEQRVVDLETGRRALPPGERGELLVRGPQVMLGYLGHPEETERAIREGWLFTGDIAELDTDGYAYIVDRLKDMIDVGGLKVFPREVEEVLLQHPAVREAAAFGVPDSALGEVVRAAVVLRPGATATAEELIGFVRSRIAHYKAPRGIDFRTGLPRSAVQKVLRRELRGTGEASGSSPLEAPGASGPGR